MSATTSDPQDAEQRRDQVLSTRLEVIDGRLASLEGAINALVRRIEERFVQVDARFAQIDVRFAQIDSRFAQVDARIANIEASVAATQNSIGGLKTTIIVTAIAVVIGVATLNATVLSNMLASFEAGINMKVSQDKLLRQSEQTEALLKQIQQGLVVPPKK